MVKLTAAHSQLFFANCEKMEKKSRKKKRQMKRYRELGKN
jgi:hypothetical protein